MSDMQKVEAAETVCKRRALASVLGLSTTSADRAAADVQSAEPITPAQAAEVEALIVSTGANRERFLVFAAKILGVDRLASPADIPASKYQQVVAALNAAAKKKGTQT